MREIVYIFGRLHNHQTLSLHLLAILTIDTVYNSDHQNFVILFYD
mgnify:CR=1 FL=1